MFLPEWGPHADEAIKRHGITEEQIRNTWMFGEAKRSRNFCWRIIGEEITLIVDKKGSFVVTMYPNKSKDTMTSRLAKRRAINNEPRKGLKNEASVQDKGSQK